MLQYVVMTDLLVLNKGKRPTFVNVVRSEDLDVTMATCGLADRVCSWRVMGQETFSDHKMIKFNLAGCAPVRPPYINPRKTDWDVYKAELGRRVALNPERRMCTKEDIDRANDLLTSSMIAACEAACPLIRTKPLYKKPLWSDDLERRKREMRRAWNVARRTEKEEDFVTFRELQRDYKKEQEILERKARKRFYE